MSWTVPARAAAVLLIVAGAAGPAAAAGDEPGDPSITVAEAAATPVPPVTDAASTAPVASATAVAAPGDSSTGGSSPGGSARAAVEAVVEPYPWRTPRPTVPNWAGAGRDALYFVGYQVFGVGVLYVLPESVSGWTEEDKRNFTAEQWKENVTNTVTWDGDSFAINWVLHPYWGAGYYVRGRERGLGPMQSFMYSTVLSALWEYGAEAIAEPVSVQDLVFTPLLGSLLGAYVFEPWRDRIRAREGDLDWMDHAVLALTDPLGAINAKLNQWLGIRGEGMQVQPVLGRPARQRQLIAGGPAPLPVDPSARGSRTWGFTLHMSW